jgi:RHS repeat-associated protein
MPGRHGYAALGGWASGSTSEGSLPADVTLNSRVSNQPPEYVASNSIEFLAGFESGAGDTFTAYIDATGGSGSGGSSGEGRGIYRYGFNGKENDNEIKGSGNQQDYGMRIYDPRLGRFLSLDPLISDYPFYTPYQFAGNKPIIAADLDGAEEWMKTQQIMLERQAKVQMTYKPKATVSTYNPNDRTFAQRWRDSENILAQMLYSTANGLYTLPQQLTADVRGADYITNIGGNVYEARGITGEKQRVSNFINGATFLVPGGQEGQVFKGLAFADDLMRLGIRSTDDVAKLLGGSVEKFVESASKIDRNGLTVIGRALQKHVDRTGSSFSNMKFSGKTATQQGLKVVDEIFNSKDQLITRAENGTTTIFDKLTGRGINVSRSGEFNGFRDLKELIKK